MPRWNDNTDLYKVDRATDAQLRMLAKLRRLNKSYYNGDFETLSKGEAGRLIHMESAILKQQKKYDKEDKRRYGR
jgi:hypothetical protein